MNNLQSILPQVRKENFEWQWVENLEWGWGYALADYDEDYWGVISEPDSPDSPNRFAHDTVEHPSFSVESHPFISEFLAMGAYFAHRFYLEYQPLGLENFAHDIAEHLVAYVDYEGGSELPFRYEALDIPLEDLNEDFNQLQVLVVQKLPEYLENFEDEVANHVESNLNYILDSVFHYLAVGYQRVETINKNNSFHFNNVYFYVNLAIQDSPIQELWNDGVYPDFQIIVDWEKPEETTLIWEQDDDDV